jgi:hypothetical protein
MTRPSSLQSLQHAAMRASSPLAPLAGTKRT